MAESMALQSTLIWNSPVHIGIAATVIWAIVRFGVYQWRMFKSERRLDGKTVIITGANTGIGKATATDLFKRGARVILACRNKEKSEKAANEIQAFGGSGQVIVKILDLASFQSIRDFCADILREENRIDVLLNNAGVLGCPHRKTIDGFEEHFAVNHLGHFLLTNLLLDRIKATKDSRIVVTSSSIHTFGEIRFDDINYDKWYNRRRAYCNSKLANNYFVRVLAEKLQGNGITVNCVHPGLVLTEISRHVTSGILTLIYHFFAFVLFQHTPKEGAQTSIYCCVSRDLDGQSDGYYVRCKKRDWSKISDDMGVANKLWELSERLTGLDGTHASK